MSIKTIRARIILTLVVIVTITSVVFAVGLLLIKQKLEEATFGNMVHGQMLSLVAQLDQGTEVNPHFLGGWDLYGITDSQPVPKELKQLAVGSYHSLRIADHHYQVEVLEYRGRHLVLTYDISEWENQEHAILEILLYGGVIVLAFAVIVGLQASSSILSPVRALSSQLSKIKPAQRNLRIAPAYSGNEIGEIALAIDSYLQRLDAFVAREQSFSAAASHELRTPLSVIIGAVDILEGQPLSDISHRAVARIQRAITEMLGFIEATLFLARENCSTITAESVSQVKVIIDEVIDDADVLASSANNQLTLRTLAEPTLAVPPSIVKITIGNIVRNALEHTHEGSVSITLAENYVDVVDTGEGISADHIGQIFDRDYSTKSDGTGIGLDIVKRVCERFDWKIDVDSQAGKGTRVRLWFNASSN
ncbi:HAMP domain-containing sensor histidine kinase [Aurantivibrio plasticivorans]